MDIKHLTSDLTVSPQIEAGDVAGIAAAGYRSVICNRPDGEAIGQPSFEEIAAAARASGLEARYLPVVPGQMTQQDVADFAAALEELPKPVYVYCRSGARSTQLWQFAEAAKR